MVYPRKAARWHQNGDHVLLAPPITLIPARDRYSSSKPSAETLIRRGRITPLAPEPVAATRILQNVEPGLTGFKAKGRYRQATLLKKRVPPLNQRTKASHRNRGGRPRFRHEKKHRWRSSGLKGGGSSKFNQRTGPCRPRGRSRRPGPAKKNAPCLPSGA